MRMHAGWGDLAVSFVQADRIVQGTYDVPGLSAAPMAGRAVLAYYQKADDQLTLWSSTQIPFKITTHSEILLPKPPKNVRVIAPDVGGGFGHKVEV